MHIWPSKRLRKSFNPAYLHKMEWNYQRMKREQQQSSLNQKLLDEQKPQQPQVADTPNPEYTGGVLTFCQDLFFLLSCCCCCLCCSACADKE